MNKSRHAEVKIVDAETASDLVNSPRFSTLDELSDTCFEVIIDMRISCWVIEIVLQNLLADFKSNLFTTYKYNNVMNFRWHPRRKQSGTICRSKSVSLSIPTQNWGCWRFTSMSWYAISLVRYFRFVKWTQVCLSFNCFVNFHIQNRAFARNLNRVFIKQFSAPTK